MALEQVAPCLTANNTGHVCVSSAERAGDIDLPFAARIAAANFAHLISGEYRRVDLLAALPAFRVGICPVPGTAGNSAFARCVKQVITVGAKKQVIRTYAWWIIATMANKHAIRNRPIGKRPGKAMGRPAAGRGAKPTVATSLAAAGPDPATICSLDPGPKNTIRTWRYGTVGLHDEGSFVVSEGRTLARRAPRLLSIVSRLVGVWRCCHVDNTK